MEIVNIPEIKKMYIYHTGNITAEDRHTARYNLKDGFYVRAVTLEGGDLEDVAAEEEFLNWFLEEFGERGEVVLDETTRRKFCHLRWDASWEEEV